ncbi:putative quinol monooxygenase [Vibrio cyclitrophicus]|uniref:putative quinol monooxygenase n=1 Tax=Vibrio cyclitrophicus TaxID=47951 RepID=UPI000C819CF4|nr:antibiotic biosynthesis monooxygenase [Vibrio cyclitrophicus]PMH75629.1 antibiotic biosynthesis monooxygenase [Vibrio cyclitrophicus]
MPQTNETIFVTAELKIKTNIEREAAVEAIEQFCLDMQSESGCLQAIATYDQSQSDRVILLEQYANREAINQHFVMPHTQAFIERDITELVQAFETQRGPIKTQEQEI